MTKHDEPLREVYLEVNSIHAASADKIVCDPALRKLFLERVHLRLPELTECAALHRLLNLRRRSQLPRLHRIK